jgi:DNA/RNA-binding domain of Phe-tRNA-synthetase-like protein
MSRFEYHLALDEGMTPSPVRPALIWAEGIAPPEAAGNRPDFLEDLLTRVQTEGEEFISAERRKRVRAMLRFGKYKPSGRGKPASEYLLRAALSPDIDFPRVNGPVNVNNAVSLATGWPASIFDADATGPHFLIRRGRAGESYVFNTAGQVIDLEDLLCVCRKTDSGWEPCGNPVKDAMATKLGPATRRVAAVLYAPIDEPPQAVERWAGCFADWLAGYCRAERVGKILVGA